MGRIWYYDDVRLRFQHRYLETIFPLAICTISLVVIAIKCIRHYSSSKSHDEAEERLIEVEEEEDLTLQTTLSHATHVDLDKPKAETGVVTFELVLLLAQVATSIASCLYDKRRPAYTSLSYLAFWTFLSSLALLRLYFTTARLRSSFLQLWNASAITYSFEWLFEILLFWSAIIHPRSTLSRNLIIARFVITTVLCLIVLTARKGNTPVELEYENDIKPSKEPVASLLGTLSFAWTDGIIWQGWKRPLEMSDVWNVAAQDKAELVLQEFRQIKKTHMLAVRLLLYFRKEVLVQGLWCAISSVFMFVPTLLLKAILEYLEDPTSISANSAWLYVILLFVTGIIQALGDGQSLWIGRKVCIRIRAVIIGEIYSKVLRRKAAASAEESKKEESEKKPSWWKKIGSWSKREAKKSEQHLDAEIKKPTEASNGTVINLMSIDSFKVSEICAYLHFLWAATPVQLIMAVALLYKVLGYSSFVGITLMVLVLPLNMWIAKAFQSAQKRIMTATDARIHATNEVLTNIRIIKYFAWEQRFEDNVNEKRRVELNALWKKYVIWSSAATIWSGVPILITFISFLIFTKVEKRPLVPSIAFPALSMFSLLRIPLDQLADMVAHVQESKVSVDRVEAFLGEEETEKYIQLKKSRQSSPGEIKIALQHATLSHGTVPTADGKTKADGFRLIDMN
ncbi:Transporter of the ATP-binding cassette (ABC), partial [Elasticomyces elasticus]